MAHFATCIIVYMTGCMQKSLILTFALQLGLHYNHYVSPSVSTLAVNEPHGIF